MRTSFIGRLTLAAGLAALGTGSLAQAQTNPGPGQLPPVKTTKCTTQNGYGCLNVLNLGNGPAIRGENDTGGVGLYGVYLGSSGGAGLSAVSGGGGPAIYGWTFGNSGTMLAYFVGDQGSNPPVWIDDKGNLFVGGYLYTSGFCQSGCSKTRHVTEYTPRTTEPKIDDEGEATLHNGSAHVALDPAFANAIDPRSRYLVTITPEGDSNGLYVANRTATGFDVRESRGGRSTLGFAYRIVAKPFGVNEPRLQINDDKHLAPPATR
jgi:hypothetical protein